MAVGSIVDVSGDTGQTRLDERMADLIASQGDTALGRWRERGARVRRGSGTVGHDLAERLPDTCRVRLATMALLESWGREQGKEAPIDSDLFVFAGCQVLEEALRRLLLPVAEPVAIDLVESVSDLDGPRSILVGWREGKVPIGLGVLQCMLVAFRRSVAMARVAVHQRLDTSFLPGYLPVLASKGPEKCLGVIRERYRNPVAHGTRAMEAADVEEFLALLLGVSTLSGWQARGPMPQPPAPRVAVLHHHLSWMRGAV